MCDWFCLVSFVLRFTAANAAGKARHQRSDSGESPGQSECRAIGSLKTEEKTECQCGQSDGHFRVTREIAQSISVSASQPAPTRIPACRHDRVASATTSTRWATTARTLLHLRAFPARPFRGRQQRSLTIVSGSSARFGGSRETRHVFVGEFDPGSG